MTCLMRRRGSLGFAIGAGCATALVGSCLLVFKGLACMEVDYAREGLRTRCADVSDARMTVYALFVGPFAVFTAALVARSKWVPAAVAVLFVVSGVVINRYVVDGWDQFFH
jgi:hypothetical protein